MYQVMKRDGSVVDFEISKISAAMVKAFDALEKNYHPSVINLLALQVCADFEARIYNDMVAVEDIQDFAGVLRVGKQTGGNLPVLFENSMLVIEEKISVKQEILTLISAKRLESRIMSVIPFVIIFYVDTTSKGYFDVLYTGVAGKILMTACLGVYIFAVWMSGRIMDIEI